MLISLARRRWAPAFLLAAVFAAVVLGHYHDRYWLPADEGAYAHVADRILHGEVLNRDVQDIHAGYINFANALALRWFGDDLVSLRYPLVAMGVLQACLIFFLLLPGGTLTALAGAMALTSLSTVQFLNPTAHWYALFLFLAIVGALTWWPRDCRWRLELIGFLLVTLFLFRQLTGVIVAIGVLTFILLEASGEARGRSRLLGRAIVAVMIVGLGGYLFSKIEPFALVLSGTWPVGILVWSWIVVGAPNARVLRILYRLGLGGAVAAAPLTLYHIANGSVGSWLADTVLSATSLTQLDFISTPFHLLFLVSAAGQVIAMDNAAAVINGVFWLSLLLLGPANGALVLMTLARQGAKSRAFHPLPFLAVFYALVSVHYQVPIYLSFTVAVSLASLLWMTTQEPSWLRLPSVLLAVGLSVVGLYYHAAQPLSRTLQGGLLGHRVALESHGLDRASLWMETADAELYRHLVGLVHRETRPDETILAVPFNPELYFLSRRENPFRFFNTALGILDSDDLRQALETLEAKPPKLVFYRPDDKYNTSASAAIMTFVRRRYEWLETQAGFEVYRLRLSQAKENMPPPD